MVFEILELFERLVNNKFNSLFLEFFLFEILIKVNY